MSKKPAFIDTSVFLRFLVFDQKNPQLSKQAKEIFHRIQSGNLCVETNICIVSELVYVLEGYYELSKPMINEKLVPLLSLENLSIENKGLVIYTLSVYQEKNVDFEDAYTYALMGKNDITEIYTFDKKDFSKFKDIKVLS